MTGWRAPRWLFPIGLTIIALNTMGSLLQFLAALIQEREFFGYLNGTLGWSAALLLYLVGEAYRRQLTRP